MDLLHQVVVLNNEGVGLLGGGNATAGVARFQQATLLLKTLSSRTNDWPVGSHQKSKIGFGFERTTGLVELRNDLHFIYSRPLVLSPEFDTSRPNDLECMVLVASTTIIFNLALAWHARGMATGQSAHLQKAGQLYDLVVNVVSSANNNDPTFIVLECVALNNMAQLCYELGDYEASLVYMEDICDHLLSNDCLLDSHLHSGEADEILINLSHVQLPSTAAAA